MRVGINGLGRIGRGLFKSLIEDPRVEVAALNDVVEGVVLAHLLNHDSYYHAWGHRVEATEMGLRVDGREIPLFRCGSPSEIPWDVAGVDGVVDATGRFKDGGLGGLGLKVAEWLAQRGARHLVLIGRTGLGGDDAVRKLAAVQALQALGVTTTIIPATPVAQNGTDSNTTGTEHSLCMRPWKSERARCWARPRRATPAQSSSTS